MPTAAGPQGPIISQLNSQGNSQQSSAASLSPSNAPSTSTPWIQTQQQNTGFCGHSPHTPRVLAHRSPALSRPLAGAPSPTPLTLQRVLLPRAKCPSPPCTAGNPGASPCDVHSAPSEGVPAAPPHSWAPALTWTLLLHFGWAHPSLSSGTSDSITSVWPLLPRTEPSTQRFQNERCVP